MMAWRTGRLYRVWLTDDNDGVANWQIIQGLDQHGSITRSFTRFDLDVSGFPLVNGWVINASSGRGTNYTRMGGYGQGILFSISAIWLINSTPRAINYFNSWWCVIEQLHATRHPLDYILVMRACPHLFQRSTLRTLPNSSYRDQIFMHRRSI